jgi:hypothetical protein
MKGQVITNEPSRANDHRRTRYPLRLAERERTAYDRRSAEGGSNASPFGSPPTERGAPARTCDEAESVRHPTLRATTQAPSDFSLVVGYTLPPPVQLPPELDFDLERGAIAQLDPLAFHRTTRPSASGSALTGAHLLIAPLSKVTEADEQPLDRLTAEFADMPHAEKGAKPTM